MNALGTAGNGLRGPLCLMLACLLLPASGYGQPPAAFQALRSFEAASSSNNFPDALKYGREALRLLESTADLDRPDLVGVVRSVAEVAAKAGQDAEALQLYQRVLSMQEQDLGAESPDLVPALTALAELQLKGKHYVEAESLLQRVLQIERAAHGEGHEEVLAALQRLQQLYRASGNTEALARIDQQLQTAQTPAHVFRDIAPEDRRYKMDHGIATVRVFYCTNRAPSGKLQPAEFYGNDYAKQLQYGYLDVTIPQEHKEAELETRWEVLTYFVSDANLRHQYVMLDKVAPLAHDGFLSSLQRQISSAPSRDVFVFVHGYNNSFEDAARRTAQLAYDMDFDGTPLMFAWPSQASILGYFADENAVENTGFLMTSFLEDIALRSGAERIHLIAHSMGNRPLLAALERFLLLHHPDPKRATFGQIVFTAPDVDRDYFENLVQSMGGAAARVTLYASDHDRALELSRGLHKGVRAGLAGPGIVTLPGLDSIDMSAVHADTLGHTYFAANEGALFDLFRLLWRGDPPKRRCGMNEQRASTVGSYYQFMVAGCEGEDLLEAGVLVKRFGDRALSLVQANVQTLTDRKQQLEWQRILLRMNGLLPPDGLLSTGGSR